MQVFIDSNIPMYVAGAEHPNREPARHFLARVQAGQVEGYTSAEVLQEILYRHSALRRIDLAREVYNLFVQICPVLRADPGRRRRAAGFAAVPQDQGSLEHPQPGRPPLPRHRLVASHPVEPLNGVMVSNHY